MLEKIALILDVLPAAILFLLVIGSISHVIPRAMAKRISRMEDSWDRDSVENDRLGLLVFMMPAFALILAGLFRLVTGLMTSYSGGLLLMGSGFAAFVLFTHSTPLLRYDTTGIHMRIGFGKTVFLPWNQITSVQWVDGTSLPQRFNRARPLTPVVAVFYSSSLFGKPYDDVCYLDPTTDRGISRFMATWNARHPEEVLSHFEE